MTAKRLFSLAFIPARGGSESIPLKNMAKLGDIPLVGWSLHAATKYEGFDKIVVSTDNNVIADYVRQFAAMSGDERIECVGRPRHLTDGLSYPIQNVVLNYLNTCKQNYYTVSLFQPTSPFIDQWQIEECMLNITKGGVASAYTIAKVKHNDHWLNQRNLVDGMTAFAFGEERKQIYNKQQKEASYKFGNFVVARTKAIRNGFFPWPSRGIVIDWVDAFDVDTLEDLRMAELLLPIVRKETVWEG